MQFVKLCEHARTKEPLDGVYIRLESANNWRTTVRECGRQRQKEDWGPPRPNDSMYGLRLVTFFLSPVYRASIAFV